MPEPRYITDASGKRIAVVLDIKEYEQLKSEALRTSATISLKKDPLLDAPIIDEPLTAEEEDGLNESLRQFEAGKVMSTETLLQRLAESGSSL